MMMMQISSLTNSNCYKGKKPYKSWVKDDGYGGVSSMDVLISWLSHKPNYKRWKREDYSIDRIPKKDLLEEINELLKSHGIYHRLPKDIASKISTLQANYRITRKWKINEGYKLLRYPIEGEKLLHNELLKRFPYWDKLHPVFDENISKPDISEDFNRLINLSREKEMARMYKLNELLYILRKRKESNNTRKKRLLLHYERMKVEKELIYYLNQAGFSPSEALHFV